MMSVLSKKQEKHKRLWVADPQEGGLVIVLYMVLYSYQVARRYRLARGF